MKGNGFDVCLARAAVAGKLFMQNNWIVGALDETRESIHVIFKALFVESVNFESCIAADLPPFKVKRKNISTTDKEMARSICAGL